MTYESFANDAHHLRPRTGRPRGLLTSRERIVEGSELLRRTNEKEDPMEQWSIGDERPYLRPQRSLYPWVVAVLALAAGRARRLLLPLLHARAGRAFPARRAHCAKRAGSPRCRGRPPTLENSDAMLRDSL